MKPYLQGRILSLFFLLVGIFFFSPLDVYAATTPTMIIEEAKYAVEQARKAGADKIAVDDYLASKSWLSQAEKAYEARKSLFSRSTRAKEEEILYLGAMSKLKAMTAEAKAKKARASAELKDSQRELADYRNALEVMKTKTAEVEKAREAQAKLEEERKSLEEIKRKTAEMEEEKKRELEEAQRRAAELENLKQKELQASRLEESQRLAQKERELAEARLKAEQLANKQAREAAELKAREERLAALQKKAEAFDREKSLLAEASKVPQVTAKSGDKEVIMTILAINLFTPNLELTAAGKGTLDRVAALIEKQPGRKVVVRGHTDNIGSEAVNKTVSEKRAQKVKEYLVLTKNIDPAQITALGLGPSQPAANNGTEAGRALNRRVEIALVLEE